MVNISGSEISKTLNEMLGELRRLPELHLDKLYTIGSILVSIGEVKKIPTLKIIGKNLYLIPERLRPWLLAKGSTYGGVPEVERLMKAFEAS